MDVARISAGVREFYLADSGSFFEPTYWEHTDREYAEYGGKIDSDFASVLLKANALAALSWLSNSADVRTIERVPLGETIQTIDHG